MTRDEFSGTLLPASFEVNGESFDLGILSTSDSFGRVIARHGRPHQQGVHLRDMGGDPHYISMTLALLPPNVILQSIKLREAMDQAKVGLLIHPHYGAIDARLERFDVDANADERDYLTARAEFIEDISSAENLVRPDLAADADDAAAVESSIDDLRTELDDAGLESTAPDDAQSQLDAWEAADSFDQRSLSLELAALSSKLQEETDRLDMVTDVRRQPLIVAFTNLHSNMRNYVRRLMSTAPKLTTHTVHARQPLMTILQSIYGATGALDRFDRILELNDLDNPAAVEAGTVLTIEVRE